MAGILWYKCRGLIRFGGLIMLYRLKEKLSEKKGFTLIEMIVSISILVIITGIASVGVYGYMLSAYMNRVNETSKTVFLAAQNYLTEQKQLGNLSTFNQMAEKYGGELSKDQIKNILLTNDPDFDFTSYEEKYSADYISYILLNEGGNDSGNPIYTIVKQYINDLDLLDHTFLMEYDTRTGVVRSVFYTEKSSTLSYDNDLDSKSNVIYRDSDNLRKKRQGYYGVDTTGLLKYTLDLYAPGNIKLVNGERLYAEWKETNYLSKDDKTNGFVKNANDAFDDLELRKYLVYDIEVYKATDETEEKLFAIEGINKTQSKGNTLAAAEEKAKDNGFILAYNEDNNTYQLLLDCIHNSIFDMFTDGVKGIKSDLLSIEKNVTASDMIYCRVSVRLEENALYDGQSDFVSTNVQSSAFAGGAKTFSPTGLPKDETEVFGNGYLKEDGKSTADGSVYSVANPRHLNNIRFSSNTSCFVQRADIDWEKPEKDRKTVKLLFVPVTFAEYEGSVTESSVYKGTFYSAKSSETNEGYVLSNLLIDCASSNLPEKNVGIFRENKGTVRELNIVGAEVNGAYNVGVIAGINAGNISSIMLNKCKTSGAFYVGGITGQNIETGVLENIKSAAAVSGNITESFTNNIQIPKSETVKYGEYIGGIAGLNKGSAKGLVTSVDITGQPLKDKYKVEGIGYVGGIFGGNASKADVDSCINYNDIKLLAGAENIEDLQSFGGIAGINEEESKIINSINRAIINLEENPTDPKHITNIGGIAGTNKGKITKCESGLAKAMDLDVYEDAIIKALVSGNIPTYSGINVGGIAGLNDENAYIRNCIVNSAVIGYSTVGGLIGENKGSFWGGEEYKTSGLVIASSDTAGGIAGANTGFIIDGCVNEANVFSASVAGGIVGANGAAGSFSFNDDIEDYSYYDNLTNKVYELIDTELELKNSENLGFVYAFERYSGGISGINYASITNANSVMTIDDNSFLYEIINDEDYKNIARADCVGGIAGANFGTVRGGDLQRNPTVSILFGKDFVGGVAGLNRGAVEDFSTIKGSIKGTGKCIGGFIGINLNSQSVSKMAFNEGADVYGEYFIGGIIGCNVSSGLSDTSITGAATRLADVKRGRVKGTAYVGGIIGYNTKKDVGSFNILSDLMESDLDVRIAKAFEPYKPQSGEEEKEYVTKFIDCINRSEVYADRYAGGIVGYNSDSSALLISNSVNYGQIEILDKDKRVKDGYYFIGGITGRNSANGIIDQCVNDGSVISPSRYLGGVCEVNEGYVQFCSIGKEKNYNESGISGENSVGGVVGLNSKNVVRCSTSRYAKISGGDNTGGLVGTNDSNGIITGDIKNARILDGINDNIAAEAEKLCISSGSVLGKDNTGGIVGLNEGRVENVSVEGATISGNKYVGGFIGNNLGIISPVSYSLTRLKSEIKEISGLVNNAKKVTGVNEVGGIVGKHNAVKITACINQGIVEATGEEGYAGGITGSVGKGISVEACINYGTVISNKSYAGGITGNNKGIIYNCDNYGSVTGSTIASSKSAIGGIAGINEKGAEITNCISANNESDPNKEDNPNISTPNSIRGIYIVGGIAGYNAGKISNVNRGSNVDINIKIIETKLSASGNIGGVIGSVDKNCSDTISNYTYSGTIEVTSNASQPQYIGGIIGQLYKNMTLDNCVFAGDIKGYGNSADSAGAVGGLAGKSSGTVIVYKNNEGIYTAGKEGSSVAGLRNVGGLTGIADVGHNIKLKTDAGVAIELSQMEENRDDSEDNDIYYVNLSNVSGLRRVGGIYGRIYIKKGFITTYTYLQNGLKGSDAGNIIPFPNGSESAQAIGGIIGTLYEADKTQTVKINNLINYGNIGNADYEKSYISKAMAIGGLIGNSQNTASVGSELDKLYNYGNIMCGSSKIGGITGVSYITKITDCYNYGNINTRSNTTGGIVGNAEDTVIKPKNESSNIVFNEGSITINGNFAGVGGIAGYYYNIGKSNSEITGVQNNGNIYVKRTALHDAKAGGIAGGVYKGNNSVTNCINNGAITLNTAHVAGGIVGDIGENSSCEVTNCTNNANVYSDYQDIGGIVGRINTVNKITVTDNTNSGDIYSKFRAGGIIGYIVSTNKDCSSWELSNCTNGGDIYGIIPNVSPDKSNAMASHIGGCIGYITCNTDISNFTNTGKIVLDNDKSLVTVKTISQIGGIIGFIGNNTDRVVTVSECSNTGSFEFKDNLTGAKILSIGGIVGEAKSNNVFEGCINSAVIDLSAVNNVSQGDLGGILGKGEKDSKVVYCTNKASVIGNINLAENVGGIAGKTEGLVYSCSTINNGADKNTVQGRKNVGGLVGDAAAISCKITSVAGKDNTEIAISSNSFIVKGAMAVGGIAGHQGGATIHTVMNTGASEVILVSDGSTRNNAISAGGITGLAEYDKYDNTLPGIIVNCYSFGRVSFEGAGKWYLGGIIGFRSKAKYNIAGESAAAVKDSFYLHDAAHEKVDSSKPVNNIDEAVLAIGNEPDSLYVLDIEDQQYGDTKEPELSTDKRFLWSQAAYEKMYRVLHGTDDSEPVPNADSWDSLDTVLSNIVPFYNRYKLKVPKTDPVVLDEVYNYTLPVTKMPGFCSYLEVNLYTEDTDDEAVRNETAEPLLQINRAIEMDNQLIDIAFDVSSIKNYEQYVGKVIRVAVRAHGVDGELDGGGEFVYTADSDLKVVQEFVVMPVLVRPEVEYVDREGTVLKFKIANWEDYQKSAMDLYKSIAEDPVLRAKPIYQSLLEGLLSFTIKDYYLAKENGERDKNITEDWTISKADIDVNGMFTIDYSTGRKFSAQHSQRQYHSFDVKAIAMHTDWSVEAGAVKSKDLYRYSTSDIGKLDFQIKAVVPLEPPTNLKSKYMGGIDWEKEDETPSYEISFSPSTSPKEAIGDYLITITNPSNGKTHSFKYIPIYDETIGDEGTVFSYVLTKDTLLGGGDNELGVDISPDSEPAELTYTISARPNTSDAAKYFENSKDSEGEITIIKKEYAVKTEMWTTVENELKPNEITFHWNDDYMNGNEKYIVSYKVKNGDSVISENTDEDYILRDYLIVLPDDAKEYTVEFSVVKKGVYTGNTLDVRSLNSDRVTYIKEVGKLLDKVTNVAAEFSKVENDIIYYNVTFDIPSSLSDSLCSGFWLQAVNSDSTGEALSPAVEVGFDTEFPVEIAVPVANAGKSMYVHVIAKAVSTPAENSERAVSNLVTIPANRLDAPINLTAVINNAEGIFDLTSDANSLKREELTNAVYTFGWAITSTGNVSNQKLEIADGTDILYSQTTTGNEVIYLLKEDLSAYAGKKLMFKVSNLPGETNLSLPSTAAELEFYIPKIELEGVQFTADSGKEILIESNGLTLGDDAEVTESSYGDITYTINWLETMLQDGREGTQIALKYLETNADGSITETMVPFKIITDTIANTVEDAVLGEYVSEFIYNPDDYNGNLTPLNPDRSFVLTGISKDFAGKELTVYLSTVPAEGSEAYVESEKTFAVFKMPLAKADVTTSSNEDMKDLIDGEDKKLPETEDADENTGEKEDDDKKKNDDEKVNEEIDNGDNNNDKEAELTDSAGN